MLFNKMSGQYVTKWFYLCKPQLSYLQIVFEVKDMLFVLLHICHNYKYIVNTVAVFGTAVFLLLFFL